MEHRWGIRRKLDAGVKLYVRSRHPVSGRLLNASSSGGYVATGAPLPIMTRVHITLGCGNRLSHGRHRIAAYVVRSDARGIGLEWQEFAPVPVLALIDPLETTPTHSAPIDIRTITEARQEVEYLPWSHSNQTSGGAPNRG
jgi:hypothetical protein